MAIVSSVSRLLDVDPLDLDPLQDTVDIDALNAVLDTADDDTSVSFQFEGYGIAVSTEGTIDLTPPVEGPSVNLPGEPADG